MMIHIELSSFDRKKTIFIVNKKHLWNCYKAEKCFDTFIPVINNLEEQTGLPNLQRTNFKYECCFKHALGYHRHFWIWEPP